MSTLANIEIHFTLLEVVSLFHSYVQFKYHFAFYLKAQHNLLVSHTNIMLATSVIETNIQSSCHECKTATDSQELALLIVSFCSVED